MREVLFKEENLVDLSSTGSSDNFLFELTNIIEKKNLRGEKIRINFGNVDLSQNQLENVLSVLKGFGIEIEMIYSDSKEAKIVAIDLGITVSGQSPEKEHTDEPPPESSDEEISEEDELEHILWKETASESEKKDTFYIKQNLRSGQKVEHDGNVIIIGDCNAGSEVIASGDIIIWGVISGIVHAGSKGDKKACIRAFKINAIQIRITDILARKPDRIDIDKTEKTNIFNPEEAKISEGEIVIYSLHQDY